MMQPAEQHGAKPPLLQPKFSKQISANVVDEKLLDQGVNLEELYLCCVDPQTSKTFKVNIGTQEAQEVHLKAGQDVPNKIKREIYKIDELLGRKEHEEYWDFKNEMVNDYRRRMVPFYLLGEESNQYPVYVDNSDIDLSFTGNAEDETFAAGITIEEITINMSDSVSTNLPFKLSNVSLLTTADQLIKMCERKLQIQNKLSDSTKVGGAEWSRLKKEAMKENYKNSTKFVSITYFQLTFALDRSDDPRPGNRLPAHTGPAEAGCSNYLGLEREQGRVLGYAGHASCGTEKERGASVVRADSDGRKRKAIQ